MVIGRTARLWQTVILSSWKSLFKYIPIESIIRKNQDKYYIAIRECNSAGNSKILNLIRKDNTITQTEMAKILGITRDGISYNIRILRKKGILERIGSTKNGIWKIYDKI